VPPGGQVSFILGIYIYIYTYIYIYINSKFLLKVCFIVVKKMKTK
jgi:hypothetical protein